MRDVKRSRMARGVALMVGLALLILGLAPYGFGLQAQTIVTTLVDQLAHVWLVPIVITRYQRGWFASTAEMFLTVSPGVSEAWRAMFPSTPQAHEAPAGVHILHDVRHGPFPFAPHLDGVGRFRPVQALLTTTMRPGSPGHSLSPLSPATAIPTLHVHTTVFLSGASQSRFLLPALTTPAGDSPETPLIWDGLRGEVSLTENGHHLLGALRAPGLQWRQEPTQVRLRNALARLEARSEPHQPLHGQLAVNVDAVEVAYTAEEPASWAFQDSALRTTMALGGELLQTAVDLRCSTCRLATMVGQQGTAHLAARRLHLPTLYQLGREVSLLWPAEADITTLWFRLLFSGALAHWLAGMARTNPTLDLSNVHLQTPEGPIHLTAHIALDGARVVSPGRFPQLLQTIEAHTTLEAPAAWVQTMAVTQAVNLMRARSALGTLLAPKLLRTMATMAVSKYLRDLVEQAYLIQEGTTYKSTARYTGGQLWVNDKPVELPPLVP